MIKQDLINDTLESDPKYHNWINEMKKQILPQKTKDTHENEVNINPQKYIPYMIQMNILLEQKELKGFQFFPLRTEIVPKYIPLDTASVVELLIENGTKYKSKLTECQDEIWSKILNLDSKVFSKKNYVFDYSIMTNGYDVSIRFINNKYVEKKIKINEIKQTAQKAAKKEYKGMSQIEVNKIKIERDNKQKEIKKQILSKLAEQKREFKKKNKRGTGRNKKKYGCRI